MYSILDLVADIEVRLGMYVMNNYKISAVKAEIISSLVTDLASGVFIFCMISEGELGMTYMVAFAKDQQ